MPMDWLGSVSCKDYVSPVLSSSTHKMLQHIERPAGFCYIGTSSSGLLKIGMTYRCPLCRMKEQNLRPRGFCYSDTAALWEQRMLLSMGKPHSGREWFDNPEERIVWLVENSYFHDILHLQKKVQDLVKSKETQLAI